MCQHIIPSLAFTSHTICYLNKAANKQFATKSIHASPQIVINNRVLPLNQKYIWHHYAILNYYCKLNYTRIGYM